MKSFKPLFLLCYLCVFTTPIAATSQHLHDYDLDVAPFSEVKFNENDKLIAKIHNIWYEILSVENVPVKTFFEISEKQVLLGKARGSSSYEYRTPASLIATKFSRVLAEAGQSIPKNYRVDIKAAELDTGKVVLLKQSPLKAHWYEQLKRAERNMFKSKHAALYPENKPKKNTTYNQLKILQKLKQFKI